MQSVSQGYRQAMLAPLRNRGYIIVRFGNINGEAQADASLASGDYLWYSNSNRLFSDGSEDIVYGTLEENFCKVDGSMYYLPYQNSAYPILDTGVISSDLVSDGNVTVEIALSSAASWHGLEINFGENYPTDFDIVCGEDTYEIRDNDQSIVSIDEDFSDAESFQIVVSAMKEENTRLRIYYIQFGIGVTYSNANILDSSLTREVSPISEFVPQFDFSVKLLNENGYFDVENPDSDLSLFDSGVPVNVSYGMELNDGTIEWIHGQTLQCSDWSSDDLSATIHAKDRLRDLNDEYYLGEYDANGKTYKALAEAVFADAGITDYYIDSSLANLSTKLPIPRVSHKEALQLIANACCCILTISRSGRIEIRKPNLIPELFIMEFSDMIGSQTVIKSADIKSVVVSHHSLFQRSNAEYEMIFSEEITVTANEERVFLFDDPLYDYQIEVEGVLIQSTIQASGAYYVKLKFASGGTIQLDISAKRYQANWMKYTKTLGNSGDTVNWDNPLIESFSVAYAVAEMLASYYEYSVEYEYDTRGNPELDISDFIWQANKYISDLSVRITKYTLNFKQAFSGHATTRREGV